MSAIYLLLPIGLLMAATAIAWFIWAVRTGQFDDLDTPAERILFDDEDLTAKTPATPEDNDE
ncbi:MAG: cbb3-type cytochrome oxidase assembly protein CcoS [Candidatus Dadabacteria bacterium]|nr:MAG: cbb3-type cytochrome oxidase assembly protein CcoS [Candidatus Dadabacteria bacterium]